jgi:hypothetical protein
MQDDLILEAMLFISLLLVLAIAELNDKRKKAERLQRITDFNLRGSAATTNSHVDDTLVSEFINKS